MGTTLARNIYGYLHHASRWDRRCAPDCHTGNPVTNIPSKFFNTTTTSIGLENLHREQSSHTQTCSTTARWQTYNGFASRRSNAADSTANNTQFLAEVRWKLFQVDGWYYCRKAQGGWYSTKDSTADSVEWIPDTDAWWHSYSLSERPSRYCCIVRTR